MPVYTWRCPYILLIQLLGDIRRQDLSVNIIMNSQSPRFRREQADHSPSPLPLRSPSPDVMSRSAIISTRTPQIHQQHKSTISVPLVEEVRLLREENMRLTEITASRGDHNTHLSLNEQIKEKDRIINSLRNQLKNADVRSSKGLSLIGSSHHRPSSGQHDSDLRKQNDDLTVQVRKLYQQNQELKSKKAGSAIGTPQKPKPVRMDDPLPYVSQNPQIQLTRSTLDKIKEQLSQEIHQSVSRMINEISRKLDEVERRVTSIESKLTGGVPDSGQKGASSSKATFPYDASPITGSYYQNMTQRNTLNTPEDRRSFEHSAKANDMEEQLFALRRKLGDADMALCQRQQQNRMLQQELTRLRNNTGSVSSMNTSQARNNQLVTMRQQMTSLSGQILILRNTNTSYENENKSLRQQLESQRQAKLPSFGVQPFQSVPSPVYQSVPQQSLELNQQIQALQMEKRKQNYDLLSLRDTLDGLRSNFTEVQDKLDQEKQVTQTLRSTLEGARRENSQLLAKVKYSSDSNTQIANQTQIMKLRLKINELENTTRDKEFFEKELKALNSRSNSVDAENRDLKARNFDLEEANNNLTKESQRAYGLALENNRLKQTIDQLERSALDLMKGSDHTKNQLIRVNQDRQSLQAQLVQLRSNSHAVEQNSSRRITLLQREISDLKQNRIPGLQKQNIQLQQQVNGTREQLNQMRINLGNTQSERDRLVNENKLATQKLRQLEAELNRLRADNQKQLLFQQVNDLTHRLRESEMQVNNWRNLQQQRNSELQNALAELSEAKRLLTEMNFESVESIIKELQYKEKVHFQERQEMARMSQQINKLTIEGDKLKRQALDWRKKSIQHKEAAERVVSLMSHLEADNRSLKEKVDRFDDIIKQYISQDNVSMLLGQSELKDLEDTLFDETEIRRQLLEVDRLKEPVHTAVNKLDRIAEMIANKIGQNKIRRSGHGVAPTQSHMVTGSGYTSSNAGQTFKRL